MSFLTDSLLEQLIQSIAAVAWQRPELAALREPIEATLKGSTFRKLTVNAFETFAASSQAALPQFLDAGFIAMPAVQKALAAYIIKGETADVTRLAELYAKRHLKPADAPDMAAQLSGYLTALRETFAADSTYGPILLARDVQSMAAALNNLRGETQTGFAEVIARLDALLKEPEIKALVERKQGTHLFLSYSRQNLALALQIRNALEDAGHVVWQDTTAIKGGAEWIRSIEDGIERAYAVVSVVSRESQLSEWVTIEFLHAKRRNKFIVPIKIDESDIPTMMLALNVVFGFPNLPDGIHRLLATLAATKPEQSALSPEQAVLPSSRGELEMAYLDEVLLEYSVWQKVYTPMAGVANIRQNPQKREIKRAAANIQPMFSSLRQSIQETFEEQSSAIEQTFEDITEVVRKVKHLVVLGDPGAGKTTTLWKLAADYAEVAKCDTAAPLPVFLRLGNLPPAVSVKAQLQTQLGALPLETLLAEKRLALLIDALNELPTECRAEKVNEVKKLIEHAQQHDLVAVVTCREQDYQDELELGIQERVQIAPLDPPRIRQFCLNHLPDDGENLFWNLVGGTIRYYWQVWQQEQQGDFDSFWNSNDKRSRTPKELQQLRQAMRGEAQSRSLFVLARNPYMLFMITEVYSETGTLPQNRGKLFDLFTNYLLLKREKLTSEVAEALRTGLANMAYMMQAEAKGTAIERNLALAYLTEEQLYQAGSANLLDGTENVRFVHQMLQEYFAAEGLDRERKNDIPATYFWPPATWWQSQGWEETAILLTGLYSDDPTPIIEWLRDANPGLTARCIRESGAIAPDSTIESLRLAWLPRLTNLQTDPQPESRTIIGRVLAQLNLDTRSGIGLSHDSLPDIAWGKEIPPGVYIIGDDKKAYNPLPEQQYEIQYSYQLARYPVTYQQFQAFLDAADGFGDERWWNQLTESHRKQPMCNQSFRYANSPRDSVSWYQAVAFCRWLTVKYREAGLLPAGCEIRLPTEQEWEIAARYPDGRFYPWGNEYISGYANVNETAGNIGAHYLRQTTAVGLYPQGRQAELDLDDLAGNVWEWCLNEYQNPEQTQIAGIEGRSLRGGSWFNNPRFARCASRYRNSPELRFDQGTFRVTIGISI